MTKANDEQITDPTGTPTTSSVPGWTVRHSHGSACRFHQTDPDTDTGHQIWIHQVQVPSVVFGSTQLPAQSPLSHLENEAPEVCRRRSGGGLVVIQPGDLWIDAVVPRSSTLHHDDVGRAFDWFGQVWLEALSDALPHLDVAGQNQRPRLAEPIAHRRAADRPFHCFAEVGHGEVLIGDRKVVGISQRRTRSWTRLQSLLITSWSATEVDSLVARAVEKLEAADIPIHLPDMGSPPYRAASVSAGLGSPIDQDRLIDALLSRLPSVPT